MVRAEIFRVAAPTPVWRQLAKTALQAAVFWTLFLFVIPALLVDVSARWPVASFAFPWQRVVGAVLFTVCSALNLATAVVLAVRGRGTPLPLDCPSRLVVAGPYAYVRNPMALAGLGQGAAVALWLGSWLVLVYVAAGALVWQWGVRPIEERDLSRRFGRPYEEYGRAVRCWLPRTRPFRGRVTTCL